MTTTMRELLQVRDEFRRRLAGTEGLVSIGFAKGPEGPYLRVVVDRGAMPPVVPDTFRTLPVRVIPGSPAVVAIGPALSSLPG